MLTESNVNYRKPYYTLYGTLYCSGIVYVNDVVVAKWVGDETKGTGGFSGEISINQSLLQSGKYEVKVIMLPRKGSVTLSEEEAAVLDFYLADLDEGKWKESRHKFHPRIESPWGGLDEGINYPVYELVTEIEVELPFILEGWQDSVDLKEIKEKNLFDDVLAVYRQIHSVLKSHNVSKFLEISEDKMKLQEEAFYFSDERKKKFRESALSLFNQKLTPLPLNRDELKIEIMGHGKLVRMVRLDGSSALQYESLDPDKQGNIEFDVKLHKRSEKKGFTII